jgi:tight adherence protein C
MTWDWDHRLTLICTFLAVSAVVGLAVLWLFGTESEVSQRLGELSDPHSALLKRRPKGKRQQLRSRLQALLAALGLRLLPANQSDHSRLQQQLLHAGLYAPSTPFIFAAARFVVGLVVPMSVIACGSLGLIGFTTSTLIAGWISVAGLGLPMLWLKLRGSRRQTLLRSLLPDFLDLMVTCLEAGQSFEAALQRVTDELRNANPVLALELTIVQREMALGAPPARALRNLAERSGLDVLRTLSTFVDQAQRFGCSMTESLRTHAEMLRDQREQRAETMAQKAAVKILFPTLLCIFPPILITLAGPAAIELHEKLMSRSSERQAPSILTKNNNAR